MGFFDGGFGGIVSGVLGAIGGASGSALDAAHDRDLARMNADFQREVYQNQLQWKAADARKAGLHPLAALGGGSYSASNIASGPSTSYSKALGQLGEGIGDGVVAYMNKDQIAAELKKKQDQDDRKADADIRATNAQADYWENMSKNIETERVRRALKSTIPMATGREVIKGQTNAPRELPLPNYRGLGSMDGYAVTPLDRGYSLTWSEDRLTRTGDELGQALAAVDIILRELDSAIFGSNHFGMTYHHDTGTWFPEPKYSKNRREASGKLFY